MFDRLDDILIRFEELLHELGDPVLTSDPEKFRRLMKEQAELAPLVETYTQYKKTKKSIEENLELLEQERDEEMRELLKEDLAEAKKQMPELEKELKLLLLPKDPNDEKNVFVEIRAGAGGDEAALFAADLFRMYSRFAERNRWKSELISVNESGIGGMKEVVFMIPDRVLILDLNMKAVCIVFSVCLRQKAADESIRQQQQLQSCRRQRMSMLSLI